eukprot:5309935-Alexandrium_andersonii.AAC.1
MSFEDAEASDDIMENAGDVLSISTAGLVCVEYSPAGSRERGAGATDQHHSIWLVDRLVNAQHELEDIAFCECSDKYPMEEKQVVLRGTHYLVHRSEHLAGHFSGWSK